MSNRSLYSLWGILFIICAAVGFIPEPPAKVQTVFTTLSILFFLPPGFLIYSAHKRGDRNTLKLVRNLSLASLGLSLLFLVGNLLSAMQSESFGNVLYGMLIVISCPMVCSGYWALSLFLWACLLMATIGFLRK